MNATTALPGLTDLDEMERKALKELAGLAPTVEIVVTSRSRDSVVTKLVTHITDAAIVLAATLHTTITRAEALFNSLLEKFRVKDLQSLQLAAGLTA